MEFPKIRNYLFLGLLLAVTFILFNLLKVFAYPMFWAAVIAAMFYPLYRWINNRLKHENISSLITLAAVLVVIIVPLAIMSTLLVKQSFELYTNATANSEAIANTIHSTTEWVKNNRFTAKLNVNDAFWVDKFAETTQKLTTWLINGISKFTQDSVVFFGMFIIMFYTLFFFLRDGEKLLKRCMHLCPLGDKYEMLLYRKFTSAVRATLKGTLTLSFIQAVLGTILFMLTGVPGALILGLIMMVSCMIPGLGSFVVWFPVGIGMLLSGQYLFAIIIFAVGMLIISTVDNLLRPVLVGKDLQLHPLLILFSTLGGLVMFGASGFIIGPVIAALFMAFWHMYEEYYKESLSQN